MMFNNKEKDKMLGYFEKIINKTYDKKTQNSYIDNQFIKMCEVLRYYDKAYGVDFQKSALSSLKESSYENLLKNLNHDINDDKQKDEGIDIQNEDIEKDIQDQIDKSKMPSETLDKEQILKELEEMAEDEKDITEKDIKNFVKVATIKAIYTATLEKYEKNKEQIKNHTDRQTQKYGDFTPEDRLAAENRQYEVYLQKLAKEYKTIVPNHKSLQTNEKVAGKEKEIRDEHNKDEELKEKKREEEIVRIALLYEEKRQIEEEMAQMSANPMTFNQKDFEELKEKLYDVDRKLCYEKTSPAVLIENIERDERQEELEERALGKENSIQKSGVAITNKENEKIEEKNNQEIKNKTMESQEKSAQNIEDVIKKYNECRKKGDYKGAKEQYQILKTMSGSKENLQSNIQDVIKDGKEDYQTENEKYDKLRDELNLNAVNDEERTSEFDLMDAEVNEIAKDNKVDNKSMYETKETSQNEPKQHTLYGNKRPY